MESCQGHGTCGPEAGKASASSSLELSVACTLGTEGPWAEPSRWGEAARCGESGGLGGSRAASGGAGETNRGKAKG